VIKFISDELLHKLFNYILKKNHDETIKNHNILNFFSVNLNISSILTDNFPYDYNENDENIMDLRDSNYEKQIQEICEKILNNYNKKDLFIKVEINQKIAKIISDSVIYKNECYYTVFIVYLLINNFINNQHSIGIWSIFLMLTIKKYKKTKNIVNFLEVIMEKNIIPKEKFSNFFKFLDSKLTTNFENDINIGHIESIHSKIENKKKNINNKKEIESEKEYESDREISEDEVEVLNSKYNQVKTPNETKTNNEIELSTTTTPTQTQITKLTTSAPIPTQTITTNPTQTLTTSTTTSTSTN